MYSKSTKSPKTSEEQSNSLSFQEKLNIFGGNSKVVQPKGKQTEDDNSQLTFKEKLRIAQEKAQNEVNIKNQQVIQVPKQENQLKPPQQIYKIEIEPKSENKIRERFNPSNQNNTHIPSALNQQTGNNDDLTFQEKLKKAQNNSPKEIEKNITQNKSPLNQPKNYQKVEIIEEKQKKSENVQPKSSFIQERIKAFNQNADNIASTKKETLYNNSNNLSFKETQKKAQDDFSNETQKTILSNKKECAQNSNSKTIQPNTGIEEKQIKPTNSQPKTSLIQERIKKYNPDPDYRQPKRKPLNEDNSYLSFKEKLRMARGEIPNVNQQIDHANNPKEIQENENNTQNGESNSNSIHEGAKLGNSNPSNFPQNIEPIKDTLNKNEKKFIIYNESDDNLVLDSRDSQEKSQNEDTKIELAQREEKRRAFLEKMKLYNDGLIGKSQSKSNINTNNSNKSNDMNKMSNINTNNKKVFTNKNENQVSSIKKPSNINQILKNKFPNLFKFIKTEKNKEYENKGEYTVDPSVKNALIDIASEIEIDFYNNEAVKQRIKEIERNIEDSITIFDRKYCLVLINSFKSFLKSIVLDTIKKDYKEIPQTLIPKVYLAKIKIIQDQIDEMSLMIYSFYDKKIGVGECEEDIVDKNEMEANSMLYVMSERESFKEIKIDISCEESFRTKIPQDF